MKKLDFYALQCVYDNDKQYMLKKYAGYKIDDDYAIYKDIHNKYYFEYIVYHLKSGLSVVSGCKTIKDAIMQLNNLKKIIPDILKRDYNIKRINIFNELLKNSRCKKVLCEK